MNPSESLNPMAPSPGPGDGERVHRTAPVAALWVARFVALGVASGSELRTQPPLDIAPSLLDTVGSDHAKSVNPLVEEHVRRELKAHGSMRWAGESQRRRTQCQG